LRLIKDPFKEGTLDKPVIAAIYCFAMGGGFMLVGRHVQAGNLANPIFRVSE
jgi:hypothetical protein